MIDDQAVPARDSRAGVPIRVSGVTKRYQTARGGEVHALDEIDLSIDAGEFVSIVGPSGCGKSTLLMLISGLIPATAGTIAVGGAPVKGAVGNVAVVFQRDVLLDWRTVLANVMLPVEIKKLDKVSHEQKARELLRSVGLDPVLRRDLWALFHRLADDGAGVFVSSHVMDEADRCDRLLLMREGRIIADDTPDHIREKTRTADIEGAFLALVDADGSGEGSTS
jgi:ABC-type multidrug transport system ATPase subunit